MGALTSKKHFRSLRVKVITRAKKQEVLEAQGDFDYCVYTHVPPEKNKANNEVVHLLAEYLGIHKTKLVIRKGKHTPQKIIEWKE